MTTFLKMLLGFIASSTLTLSQEITNDIGSWSNVQAGRKVIYASLFLPSLGELLSEHPGGKITRIVLSNGWMQEIAFTSIAGSKNEKAILQIDLTARLHANLVFKYRTDASDPDAAQIVKALEGFKEKMNWRSNKSDDYGDDQPVILLEYYEAGLQGYTLKTFGSLSELDRNALIGIKDLAAKKVGITEK